MPPNISKAALANSTAVYALPPSLLAAMAILSEALDTRQKSDDAIARNSEALASAEAERPALTAKLDEIDMKLALETDAVRSEGLEDAVEDARSALNDIENKITRFKRVHKALIDKAIAADTAIAEGRRVLKAEKEAFGRTCCMALDAEIAAALTALAPSFARAHALRAMGVMAWSATVLQEMRIPGADHASGDLLRGGRMRLPSGDIVDLATDWRQFVDVATRELVDGPLAAIDRRAAAHRQFVPPTKTVGGTSLSVYQPNEQNVRAAEHNRAIEAREAARAEADPPKPGWSGQSWRGNVP